MARAEEKSAQRKPSQAIVDIRSLAKWLIGIFAAVAGTLVAGSQLSSLGHLEWGPRLWAAIGGFALGLTAVLVSIYETIHILLPIEPTMESLRRSVAANPSLREALRGTEMLRGCGETVDGFLDLWNSALGKEDEAFAAWETMPSDEHLKAKASEAARRKGDLAATRRELLDWAADWQVRAAFKDAQEWLFSMAVFGAVGIGIFAYAANPPEAKDGSSPSVSQTPTPVRLAPSASGATILHAALGQGCNLSSVRALALASNGDGVEVVTYPKRGCSVARFTMTSEMGQTLSLEQP
jgi:hypothetical protein